MSRKGLIVHVSCLIRKTNLVLTPEEWVRQHVISGFQKAGISLGKITVENGTKYGSRVKRTDIIVVDSFGAPLVIVECKAPHIPLTNDTFLQWSSYQKGIQAKYGLLTNGIQHYFIDLESNKVDLTDSELQFLILSEKFV